MSLSISMPKAWAISCAMRGQPTDRKSTRLNSSHSQISYAVFCLKKNSRNRQPRVLHDPVLDGIDELRRLARAPALVAALDTVTDPRDLSDLVLQNRRRRVRVDMS